MTRRTAAVAFLALLLGLPAAPAQPPAAAGAVEVVFVLDTTGSMSAMLDTMRSRIFGIWTQLLGGQPGPTVRVGVVAFRDKGDDYVTKVTDLSTYPDDIHAVLSGLKAEGGGDAPEHVNAALDEAVNRISWTPKKTGDRTARMIFLMGDAPPHMDYADDVKYPETCKKAVKNGIVINAVACRGSVPCQQAFADIAARTKGVYFSTGAAAGDAPPETKHDARLTELHDAVVKTYLPFGTPAERAKQAAKWAALATLKPAEAIDRVVLEARLGTIVGAADLLDATRRTKERVELDRLPPEELPDELRGKAGAALEAAVADRVAARARLYAEAQELGTKRTAALRAAPNARGTFDGIVLSILKTQGTKAGVKY
jgi:hypothetical protein